MQILNVLIPTLLLVGIAVIGIGLNILLRNKKFPQHNIGRNKHMKEKGIVCAQTLDRQERKKLAKEKKYDDLKLYEA